MKMLLMLSQMALNLFRNLKILHFLGESDLSIHNHDRVSMRKTSFSS